MDGMTQPFITPVFTRAAERTKIEQRMMMISFGEARENLLRVKIPKSARAARKEKRDQVDGQPFQQEQDQRRRQQEKQDQISNVINRLSVYSTYRTASMVKSSDRANPSPRQSSCWIASPVARPLASLSRWTSLSASGSRLPGRQSDCRL